MIYLDNYLSSFRTIANYHRAFPIKFYMSNLDISWIRGIFTSLIWIFHEIRTCFEGSSWNPEQLVVDTFCCGVGWFLKTARLDWPRYLSPSRYFCIEFLRNTLIRITFHSTMDDRCIRLLANFVMYHSRIHSLITIYVSSCYHR